MGDFRADIKIEIDFCGIHDSLDTSINYFPEDIYGGMDERVVRFFNSVYEKGMEEYRKAISKYEQSQSQVQPKHICPECGKEH